MVLLVVTSKIFAYDIATKERNTNEDFNTLSDAGNTDPLKASGQTEPPYYGSQIVRDAKLYAYSLATKSRVPAKDFPLASDNSGPKGIWSDGTTMWVADSWDDKLYAYSLATRARVPAQDFDTLSAAGNDNPRGIWSDGTTMWVAHSDNQRNDKLYAYSLATKAHLPARDFNLIIWNGQPQGIWSDGTTMWVADLNNYLYAYDARRSVNTNSLSSLLTGIAAIAAAPDFAVSLSVSNTNVFPSSTLTLTATVGNSGGSSASSTLRWYLSTNSTPDTNTATEIETSTLSSLGGR